MKCVALYLSLKENEICKKKPKAHKHTLTRMEEHKQ